MKFEWDPNKATANLRKHSISLDEAVNVFSDWGSITFLIQIIRKANPVFSFSVHRPLEESWLSHTRKGARIFASSVLAGPTHASAANMPRKAKNSDEMRPCYDFSGGIRGKYAERYSQGTNVVVLAPDVAEVFPDSAAVNEALRTLVRLSSKTARHKTVLKKRGGY